MRWRDRGLLALGALCVLIGIPMSFDEPVMGPATIAFGLALLIMPIAGLIGGGKPHSDHGAIVIDGSRAKIWGGRTVLTFFGVAGALFAIFGSGFDRFVGGLMAVCFVYVIGWSFTKGRGRFRIVIDQDGLTHQTGGDPQHRSWDELGQAGVFHLNGAPYLSDPEIALESFPVDAKRLARLLRDYAAKPQLRAELGTQRALDRLTGEPRAGKPIELDAHEVGEHR